MIWKGDFRALIIAIYLPIKSLVLIQDELLMNDRKKTFLSFKMKWIRQGKMLPSLKEVNY